MGSGITNIHSNSSTKPGNCVLQKTSPKSVHQMCKLLEMANIQPASTYTVRAEINYLHFLLERGELKQHSRLNTPLGLSSHSFINLSQVIALVNFAGTVIHLTQVPSSLYMLELSVMHLRAKSLIKFECLFCTSLKFLCGPSCPNINFTVF